MAAAINEPRQRRSRELLERVAEAGLGLLRERPVEAFTIVAVSERAGVSVGAIYRRFGSKETLLRHLHERLVARAEARLEEELDPAAFAGLDAEALVAAAVRAYVALAEDERALHLAFFRLAATDPEMGRRWGAYAELQRERFLALLATRAEDYAHEDPAAAAQVAYRLVFGALLPRVVLGDYEPTPGLPWGERVVEELCRACVAHLLAPARPEPR